MDLIAYYCLFSFCLETNHLKRTTAASFGTSRTPTTRIIRWVSPRCKAFLQTWFHLACFILPVSDFSRIPPSPAIPRVFIHFSPWERHLPFIKTNLSGDLFVVDYSMIIHSYASESASPQTVSDFRKVLENSFVWHCFLNGLFPRGGNLSTS